MEEYLNQDATDDSFSRGQDLYALVEAWVRAVCGDELDRLISLMRDHQTRPMMLPPPGHSATTAADLHAAYDTCEQLIEEAWVKQPEQRVAARLLLPDSGAFVADEHLVADLLEGATFAGYYVFDDRVLTARRPGERLYEAFPDLLADTDDDGLLMVGGYRITPQVVIHRNSAIPYHQFLQRNFSGHVNDALVRTLMEVAEAGAALRLALNEQHFMPAAAHAEQFEHDHWWGPPLSNGILDDPFKVGTTKHADPGSGLLHEYPCLFVRWELDGDGNKVVQIEELSDHASARQGGLRLLRYLHAIRDIKRGVFVHCDGAVRGYDSGQYAERSAKDFVTGRESASRYRKLFRLDGEIATESWSNIAARWFRGNRLMTEYLRALAPAADDGSA